MHPIILILSLSTRPFIIFVIPRLSKSETLSSRQLTNIKMIERIEALCLSLLPLEDDDEVSQSFSLFPPSPILHGSLTVCILYFALGVGARVLQHCLQP